MRQEKGRRGEREGEGDWGGGRKGRWRGTEKKVRKEEGGDN